LNPNYNPTNSLNYCQGDIADAYEIPEAAFRAQEKRKRNKIMMES
jgi:hypothetical protein